MDQTMTANLTGTMLDGRYQLIEPLGQGGMAHVYLANDTAKGGQVAIKLMRDDLCDDAEFIKRFESEARAAASLNHPNIVKVLGFGQDQGRRYIVQEYVEGSSLKELIIENGTIPWQSAVPIAIQIGLALENAHRNGIVHRDIKPHNILITKDLVAKVTDFGIARATTSNTITLTSGVTFGSVHYFSPEQARGTIVSAKSDIYSLGIVLYEMVTGRVPFDGDTSVAVAIKHLQDVPPLPSQFNPSIPRGLDQIIMRCVQKSPDNRYRDARELVDELDALMIDPNGVFGVIPGVPDVDGQTTAIQAIRPDPNYNKLREIERTISDRRRYRNRDTIIVLAIIVLSIVFLMSVGTWAWRRLSSNIKADPGRTYELENYIGKEISEVEKKLKADEIDFTVKYVDDQTVLPGIIIDQNPGEGIVIKPNTATLSLVVSGGQEMLAIPDYAGQTAERAQAELSTTFGFNVIIQQEFSDVTEGRVIRTIPAAGEKLPRGGNITVMVSQGMQIVKLPNFVGQPYSAAKTKLIELKLVLGSTVSVTVDPITQQKIEVPEANRVVISQKPAPDTPVVANSVVSLTYGTPQDYANFLNPSPTPVPFFSMPVLDRMTLATARTMLELHKATNITISYASEESRALPETALYIIDQEPAPNVQVALNDSINLLVGTQQEYNEIKNPQPTPAPSPTPTTEGTTKPTTTKPTTTKSTTTKPTTTASSSDTNTKPGQGNKGNG
ncbi:MAG: Stk1 family PASTA domain-containing Ser/Thr kinase [Saccharofermentanales bacterium]|jgi:serine/threonine protein kinase/beta-lactam-binding protein with PASTA domain